MENRENRGTRLRDWLSVDKPQLGHYHENTSPSTSSANIQNQSDKFIKYMSNLPNFLEKGDTTSRKKALSFGVLDWRRLEKWQHIHKQTHSPSSSYNSSYSSTDMSLTSPSLGQCSAKEDDFQDLKAKSNKHAQEEHSIFQKFPSLSKLQADIKLKESKREDTKVIQGSSSDIDLDCHERHTDESPQTNHRQVKLRSSNIKLWSESLESHMQPSEFLISPSRVKNLESKQIKIPDKLDPEVCNAEDHKFRNTSPNGKRSTGPGRFNRRSSSLGLSSDHVQSISQSKKDSDSGPDNLQVRNQSPICRSSRRSRSIDLSDVSQSKKDLAFCSKNLRDNGSDDRRKFQFSPLRRLLDPLVKPINLQKNAENKSLTVQALFQMSMKNGLPLFTFAADKKSGVFAATMWKGSALQKYECSWLYTFFNVDEVDNKSGWMKKRCKGGNQGYVPNVIAQMRVSAIRRSPLDEFGIREFVSYSVDFSRAEQKTPDLRLNDEVAAIVVKFPAEAPPSLDKNGNDRDYLFSTKVILPSGHHGLPSKGRASSLIERWKSGGICDCGGWDLGCRLTVLVNQPEFHRKRSNFSKIYQPADGFELYSQGGVDDERPVFSLSSFKDSVYSVEFDSSLSSIQAFSICIAFIHCRKSHGLSDLDNLFGGKLETAPVAVDARKAPSLPPSPIGRA